MPSSRNISFKKKTWQRVKGYPENIDYGEDMKFNFNLKKQGFKIIALEQTKNSISVFKFKPSKKIALVLGNEVKGISRSILKKCDKIYLEAYTSNYSDNSLKDVEKELNINFIKIYREESEQNFYKIVNEAKNTNIAFCVFGNITSATTHNSIINECKDKKIKYKIQSFAHTEFNREEFLNDEHIIKAMEEGKDIFNRPDTIYKFVSVYYYPAWLRKAMLLYPSFLHRKAKDGFITRWFYAVKHLFS